MIEKRELICVTCPRGCRITVEMEDEKIIRILGNTCERGEKYAESEIKDPRRMFASTVRIRNGVHPVLPVTVTQPFPKDRLKDLSAELRKTEVTAPVRMGDVIVKNVLGTGIDVIASRDMETVRS